MAGMRVALFGGSFDPPHTGHLRIALAAAERLRLNQVLLAPAGRQPLKAYTPAPFADRLRMLALLAAPYNMLIVSEADAPHPGQRPNYTVDTLARLRLALPAGTELFFLAGADSFLTLPHWRDPERLLRPSDGLLDGWILAARPGFALEALASALPPGYTLAERGENRAGNADPVLIQAVLDPSGAPATPLYLLPDLDDPSTATRIRDAFAAGSEAPHLTSEVAAYIHERGLYTAGSTARHRVLR